MESLLSLTFALWLAAIFGLAAYGKVMAWAELPGVIQNFRILPRFAVAPVAMVLPIVEASVCMMLLVPETRVAGAVIAAALLMVFALAITASLRAGRTSIDCGCFRSSLRQPVSSAMVTRNAILMVCALLVGLAPAPAAASLTVWLNAFAGAGTLMTCFLSFGFVFRPAPPRYEDNFHAALANND